MVRLDKNDSLKMFYSDLNKAVSSDNSVTVLAGTRRFKVGNKKNVKMSDIIKRFEKLTKDCATDQTKIAEIDKIRLKIESLDQKGDDYLKRKKIPLDIVHNLDLKIKYFKNKVNNHLPEKFRKQSYHEILDDIETKMAQKRYANPIYSENINTMKSHILEVTKEMNQGGQTQSTQGTAKTTDSWDERYNMKPYGDIRKLEGNEKTLAIRTLKDALIILGKSEDKEQSDNASRYISTFLTRDAGFLLNYHSNTVYNENDIPDLEITEAIYSLYKHNDRGQSSSNDESKLSESDNDYLSKEISRFRSLGISRFAETGKALQRCNNEGYKNQIENVKKNILNNDVKFVSNVKITLQSINKISNEEKRKKEIEKLKDALLLLQTSENDIERESANLYITFLLLEGYRLLVKKTSPSYIADRQIVDEIFSIYIHKPVNLLDGKLYEFFKYECLENRNRSRGIA